MSTSHLDLKESGPPPEKMPGHWLLARLGKRVLRPGGLELTQRLLERFGLALPMRWSSLPRAWVSLPNSRSAAIRGLHRG